MAVIKVVDGIVVQTWRDVKTVQDAVDKYGLDSADLVEGDYPPGTEYDGTTFQAPFHAPRIEEESLILLALRDLAGAVNPQAVAKLNARLGPPK